MTPNAETPETLLPGMESGQIKLMIIMSAFQAIRYNYIVKDLNQIHTLNRHIEGSEAWQTNFRLICIKDNLYDFSLMYKSIK